MYLTPLTKVKERQHKRNWSTNILQECSKWQPLFFELFEKTYKKQITLKEEFQILYLSIFKKYSFIEKLSWKYLSVFSYFLINPNVLELNISIYNTIGTKFSVITSFFQKIGCARVNFL